MARRINNLFHSAVWLEFFFVLFIFYNIDVYIQTDDDDNYMTVIMCPAVDI